MSLEIEHNNTVTHDVTDTEAVYAMQEQPGRPTDDQDRVLPEYLSNREMLIELINYHRGLTDFMTAMTNDPMIGKMFPIAGILKRK